MRASAVFSLGSKVLAGLTMVLVMHLGCSGDDQASPDYAAKCAEACAKCSVGDICGDCNGAAMRFRDEFEVALYACVMKQAACTHDWEICVGEALGAAPARDLDRTFRDACLARRTECQNQGAVFADDLCLSEQPYAHSSA